jgi:hypothetical protein
MIKKGQEMKWLGKTSKPETEIGTDSFCRDSRTAHPCTAKGRTDSPSAVQRIKSVPGILVSHSGEYEQSYLLRRNAI